MKTDQKFWYRWMLNYSAGELLGIGAAATIGRFLFVGFSKLSVSSGSSYAVTLLILIIAGMAEGLIIGYVQWKSLSKMIIDLKPKPWIVITTLATIAGWILVLPPTVMFISFLSKISFINHYYSILYTAMVGMAFGGLIGIAQFFIVNKYYRNSLVWIFANVVGWTFSFLVIYTALLWFKDSPAYIFNLVLIAGSCILSGLAQGIVTGTSLHFLMSVRRDHERIPMDNRFPL
jgi:hypothetical protein